MTGDHESSGRLRSAEVPPSSLPAADQAGDLVDDLFRTHAAALVRVAMLLLGDQPSAEDVVQDAFFGLHRSLPRLRDRDKALPWPPSRSTPPAGTCWPSPAGEPSPPSPASYPGRPAWTGSTSRPGG